MVSVVRYSSTHFLPNLLVVAVAVADPDSGVVVAVAVVVDSRVVVAVADKAEVVVSLSSLRAGLLRRL